MSKKRKNKEKKKQKNRGAAAESASVAPAAAVRTGTPLDEAEERLSKRGIKTIAGGIGLLIVGFYVLTLTDPHGRNWASTLSPILILGAYAVIGFGIFLDDPEDPAGKNGKEKTIEAASDSVQ